MTERERNIQSCRITWRGMAIDITYEANWLNIWLNIDEPPFQTAHLTINAEHDRPLPFTETGYLSHFLAQSEVENAGGAAAYVLAALDDAARSPEWKAREAAEQQLSLF
jgi:hypothetical protein